MGKPTALALAKATLVNGFVVDLRRVNEWTPDTFATTVAEDAPATLVPGRYVLIPAEDMALVLTRITAGEQALMLAAAKRTSLTRRRK